MTALRDILVRRIRAGGPMTLADYMAECLLHPEHGYYSTRDPFGITGDFVTAPEISQMFGEVLGACLAQAWMDQGSPKAFTLAELGPGRGTLMADVLRATRRVPGFHDAAQVHLVEASATLRDVQRATLAEMPVTWASAVTDLPDDIPLFLLANEFLDALPIRQFQRVQDGWAERCITASKDGALGWGLTPPSWPNTLSARRDVAIGGVVEICPALPGIVGTVAQTIGQTGGVAVFIDYGHWRSLGDTLQALAAHQPVDPLAAPGQADLTAHVDFEAISMTCETAQVSAMVPQGVLLERLGITARAQQLAQNLTGTPLESLVQAHRRLTHPAEMGDLFKAIAVVPKGAALPPGFEAP